MAYDMNLVTVTKIAGEDLSGDQYKHVGINASNKVVKPTSAGAKTLGILQNNPGSDQEATVAVGGVSKLKMAAVAAQAAQTEVMTDNSGLGTPQALPGEFVTGILLEPTTTTAGGEVTSVLISPYQAS